jgi:tetratricopeptide (TPR) repeat protein
MPEQHAHSHAAEKLGVVSFRNSGARAAQRDFIRGLALLHNFEYADAADALIAAEHADSTFAMAYWLEAMTYSHLLWSEEDLPAARAALRKLGPDAPARLARAKTPRERAYGAAIEAFLADTSEQVRVVSFADSMRHLAAAYPSDLEGRAFAALAVMMAAQFEPTQARANAAYLEAGRYAEGVFRVAPNHPGAAHYMIHAYDDPARAAKGLAAARAYARIAPSADHAQHMPSHIFVQLGLWDDDARSNEQSWASSRAWVKRHDLTGADRNFHTLNWLEYAYLQQGRFHAARALIDTARSVLAGADLKGYDNPDARYALSQLQFAYMRETGDWNAWTDMPFDTTQLTLPEGSSLRARSMARGSVINAAVAAVMRGDTLPASTLLRLVHASNASTTTVAALLERARGQRDSALALLAKAGLQEDSISPLGPARLLPVRELLGSILLEAGRYREAAGAYTRALAYMPNRSAALLGLARSQERLGDRASAARTYARLAKNWTHADADVRRQAQLALAR